MMRTGICPDCKQIKKLTKHSKIGNHQPPFVYLCRECHNERDGIKPQKKKYGKKYAKGTKRSHKKKHKKHRK